MFSPTHQDTATFHAVLRQDLPAYCRKVFTHLEPGLQYQHNWHIEHICWQLKRIARGEIKRLIINVPPRSMKSIIVSVAFTTWMMGQDPSKRIICTSFSDQLASELSQDARQVMESDWYQAAFAGTQLIRQTKNKLTTEQRGYRYATGMGGSITGTGADLIVVR